MARREEEIDSGKLKQKSPKQSFRNEIFITLIKFKTFRRHPLLLRQTPAEEGKISHLKKRANFSSLCSALPPDQLLPSAAALILFFLSSPLKYYFSARMKMEFSPLRRWKILFLIVIIKNYTFMSYQIQAIMG